MFAMRGFAVWSYHGPAAEKQYRTLRQAHAFSHVLRRDEYRTPQQTRSLTSHQSRPQSNRGLHNDYPANRPFSRQAIVRGITVLSRKKLVAEPRA
jgi:hypothetical protein